MGALTARADPQVIRLALLYALWDQSYNIEERHLRAALAVWDYCEASVSYLFGDKLGNGVADAIRSALRGSPNGLTRTDISAIFNRNVVASKIALALEELARLGLATRNADAAGRTGRPTETWFAT